MLYRGTPGGHDALARMEGALRRSFVDFLQAQVQALDGSPHLELRSRWEEAATERRAQGDQEGWHPPGTA